MNRTKAPQEPIKSDLDSDRENPDNLTSLRETQGDEAEKASIATDVKAWTEKYNLVDAGFICSLYKYAGDSRERKELCFKYTDEIPDEHTIGTTFGSGAYECIFNGMDRNGKRYALNRKFKLHKNYDFIKDKKLEGSQAITTPAATKLNGSEIGQALLIVREMFSMITPLIQAQAIRPQAQPSAIDGYRVYNDALKQSLLDNQEFFRTMQNRITEQATDTDTDTEPEPAAPGGGTFLNIVMPLLEKFIPLLIGEKKTSDETIKNFRHIPQVDAILKDKSKLKIVLDNIKKTKSAATYSRVIKALRDNKIL